MELTRNNKPRRPITERGNLRKRWWNMHDRCSNAFSKLYKDYGGRGIAVCDEWQDFELFYIWSLKNGFSKELQLGRIDINGNYEPNNCRYATVEEQANNRRSNRIETYKGVTDTVSNLTKIFRKNYELVRTRLKSGWNIKEAMDGKPKKQKVIVSTKPKLEKSKRKKLKVIKSKTITIKMLTQIAYNGKKMSVKRWSKETGIPRAILIYRLSHWGKDYDKCFNTPVREKTKPT